MRNGLVDIKGGGIPKNCMRRIHINVIIAVEEKSIARVLSSRSRSGATDRGEPAIDPPLALQLYVTPQLVTPRDAADTFTCIDAAAADDDGSLSVLAPCV
jgi:hypothetical protein